VWFLFLCSALIRDLEVSHRNTCWVTSGCLSSLPSHFYSLNHSSPDTDQPKSPSTLFLRSDPSLSGRHFLMQRLAPDNPSQIEERFILRDRFAPHRKTTLPENHWFYVPSWDIPNINFTVTTFIQACSRFDPGRPDAAADFLQRLPASNGVVWTRDSVPSHLGARGAGVHATCRRWN